MSSILIILCNSFAHGRHPTHAAACTQSQTYKQKMTQAHFGVKDKRKEKERKEKKLEIVGAQKELCLSLLLLLLQIFLFLNKLLDCEIEWKGIMKEPKSK